MASGMESCLEAKQFHETRGRHVKKQIERSLQHKAALQSPSMRSFHYRSYRLHGHSHPAVVSTTQQELCLTPTRTKFQQLERRRRDPLHNRHHYKYVQSSFPCMTSIATFVTHDDVTGSPAVISPIPPTLRSLPVTRPKINRKFLTHKHEHQSAKLRFPIKYKPPTPPTSSQKILHTPGLPQNPSTQPSVWSSENNKRNQPLKLYRSQLQSYFIPWRGDASLVGRRMAPVLRVLPTTNRVCERDLEQTSKSENETLEATSQKKVRFSDQVGFPLVRNMTPNYRRKHSYILRWLETAGRTTKALS